MGIAIASGVPPALGLITGIVGGIVTGMLAGAPLQVSGPAAGLTVLVFQIVEEYGLEALGPAVLLCGIVQFLAGSAKIGQWFRAVNPAVIYGMLSGIGVLIISSQIIVAFDAKPTGAPLENLLMVPTLMYDAFTHPEKLQSGMAAGICIFTIVVLFMWDRYKPSNLRAIPAPLVAVLSATFIATYFGTPVNYVTLPDNFADSITFPTYAGFHHYLDKGFLTAALGLAIIASAETLLCASALKKLRADADVGYNKELTAQGIGNTVCGLLGALPMTGVIVRSTANIEAQAKTRWSAVLHGIWILVFVAVFPHMLEMIPMGALAAILIYTGIKLVNVQIFKKMVQYGKPAVVIYLVTVLGIVFTDLLTGVLLGVGISFVRLLSIFSNITIKKQAEGENVDVNLKGAATFITLPKLAEALESIPMDKKVALHFDKVFYLDHACMDLFETQKTQREAQGGSFEVDSSRLQLAWNASEQGRIVLPQEKVKSPVL